MLLLVSIILFELVILYFLSRSFTNELNRFFYLLFRSKVVSLTILTVILFPGTVIHELSHLFTAEIMGVRTGKMILAPETIVEGEDIRSGSVAISRTDPFRRAIIGIAPLLWGIAALTATAYFMPQWSSETIEAFQMGTLFTAPSFYFFLLSFYFIFAVSTTMFSSPEDMKGVIPVGIVLVILILGAYLVGVRWYPPEQIIQIVETIAATLAKSLALVVGVNILVFLAAKGGTRLLQTLWKK